MKPDLSRVLGVVFCTVLIDLIGFGIIIPLLPLYAEKFSPSPLLFGLLMAVYSLFQFILAPLLGGLSDRFGRRPVLLLSLAGTVVAHVLFALAGSFGLLLLARIVAGACAGNIGTAQAVIADVTSVEDRARGMGMVGAAFGLGFVLGPAIGGFLVTIDPRYPGLCAAAFSFLAFLVAAFTLPETRNPESRPKRAGRWTDLIDSFRNPRIGRVLLIQLLAVFAFANFESTFSLLAALDWHLDEARVAWLFTLVGVVLVIVQGGLIGPLRRRFGEGHLIRGGLVATAVGLVGLTLDSDVLRLASLALLSAGFGLTNPCLSSLLSRRAPQEHQGRALGAFQSMGSLGRIGGPMSGQLLWGFGGHNSPFLLGAAVLCGIAMLGAGRAEEEP